MLVLELSDEGIATVVNGVYNHLKVALLGKVLTQATGIIGNIKDALKAEQLIARSEGMVETIGTALGQAEKNVAKKIGSGGITTKVKPEKRGIKRPAVATGTSHPGKVGRFERSSAPSGKLARNFRQARWRPARWGKWKACSGCWSA